SSANSLTVGQGVSGVLTYGAVAATLTVGGNVTVNTGGSILAPSAGAITTNGLSIGGSLSNGGTLALSGNANTTGVQITFTSAANATWTGNGSTDLRQTTGVTLNKGATSTGATLNFTPGTGTFT